MKIKRYVLRVYGCTDPYLIGPFKTAKARDTEAKKLRNAREEDAIFWLNVTDKGEVTVMAYTGGFMEGTKGFGGSY